MTILTGPVLYYRGLSAGRLRLAAIVVTPAQETPPALIAGDLGAAPQPLARRSGRALWRYVFELPLGGAGQALEYAIGERRWSVYPPLGERKRFAFVACNGTERDPVGHGDSGRYERWRHLAAAHAEAPFQLLIHGGDQLYADDVWESVGELADWGRLRRRERETRAISPQAAEAAADFYFEHYCALWSQPDVAPLLASIPSLMMWDDHDIFDGWGSHWPALQLSPAFQTVWRAAREHFALFQLGAPPEALPEGFGDRRGGHFGWAFEADGVGIIAPDLRSRRTRTQVMSSLCWRWLARALKGLGHCRHLLFVSTVPVIGVNLSILERIAVHLPDHKHFYIDDLRDQWRSYAHEAEWERLTQHLLDFSERTGTPVTILSGEIHLGALGVIERRATRLHQLTVPGIAHPPPPKPLVRFLDLLGRGSRAVGPETTLRMLPIPGFGRHHLDARAWLSLDFDPQASLHAQWHAEGGLGPIEFAVERHAHPVERYPANPKGSEIS